MERLSGLTYAGFILCQKVGYFLKRFYRKGEVVYFTRVHGKVPICQMWCSLTKHWYAQSLVYSLLYSQLYFLQEPVLSAIFCTLYTVHCTLCTVHCKLYTVHCSLYTVHCTMYTIVWTVHCTVYTLHCTTYTVQCTSYSVNRTVYTSQCTLYTPECTLYSAHRIQWTLYSLLYTDIQQYIAGCTLNYIWLSSSPSWWNQLPCFWNPSGVWNCSSTKSTLSQQAFVVYLANRVLYFPTNYFTIQKSVTI